MRKMQLLIAMLLSTAAIQAANPVKITVFNSLDTPRDGEMVEISLKQLQAKLGDSSGIIITDADGQEVPSQQTYDGKLLFQVGVGAKGKSIYYAKSGTPATYESKVFGRQFPERVDDMAWENDRVAFRCYGPALERSGERAWGYDIWNKRTDQLIVEARYSGELDPEVASVCRKLRQRGLGDLADDLYNAVSYHVDHGNGMDCYKVGPTLGAGTAALLVNDSKDILYPHCYQSYEILDCGPLRFTVRLTYAQREVEGQQLTETRIISLDAGSQMNKVVVSYIGLQKPMPLAVGIVVHNENLSAYVVNENAGYMGYEDLGDPNQYKEKYRALQNKDFGKIYVGAVYTERPVKIYYKEDEGLPGAQGHVLGVANYRPTTNFTYYFGSGWSRNPSTSFHSLTDWEAYLSVFSKQVKTPLKVKF